MTKKERTRLIVEKLKEKYPEAVCSLTYETPFQLLIATRLSAQCTDKRVNIVTKDLFSDFPDAFSMANADIKKVEELIKSCGLYKTKARDLIEISKRLVTVYGGKVPESMEDLTSLSGVGRKTANLVRGDIFGYDAVVTDTHFIRICNRLGLINTTDPYKAETEMRKLLPKEESSDFCHRAVLHGRDTCKAGKCNCDECVLNEFCLKKAVKK